MTSPLAMIGRYTRWLHTRWPAGAGERLPIVREDGSTHVPGIYVTGDLTGIPLLKFASDSGARTVRAIASDPAFRRDRQRGTDDAVLDLVIIGAGVSGMAAALAAREAGLRYECLEASEPFSTLVNFPKGKPIYTYPESMTPAGALQFTSRSAIKEGLVEEMRDTILAAGITPRLARAEKCMRRGGRIEVHLEEGPPLIARRVIIAIGRSGDFRRLGVPGEDRDEVYNRLHDPADFHSRRVCVVGGGDSALETACALAEAGAEVTLSYRRSEFGRPRPANVQRALALASKAGPRAGRLRLALGTRVVRIESDRVVLALGGGGEESIPNDAVFTMIGREPPLDFLRRCGLRIRGDWTPARWVGLLTSLILFTFLYNWKADGEVGRWFFDHEWFPWNLPVLLDRLGASVARMARSPSTLIGTMAITIAEPGFWYSLAYSIVVALFGVRRIRRRRTPYITLQTLTLVVVQVVPLFLLPYIALPWAGHNGWFDSGASKAVADALFPVSGYGHGREYWRAVGLILAWPLFIWNVFTWQPMTVWIVISIVQTFVIIPILIFYWGKGAYCGWICTCGALAETLGDDHRHKMPHGPAWNRLNMLGQVILALSLILLGLRVVAWLAPAGPFAVSVERLYEGMLFGWQPYGIRLNYKWTVDLFLSGIIGVGTYFWLSGRVWCRFACPLAALMHIYARFSRFRILADKKKCISCNVCTSVCHQGIDVMSFANKGLPMADPECVRCSACVQQCPTGTLSFGRIDPATGAVLQRDRTPASPLASRT